MNQQVDFIVVGLGLAGAALIRELRRHGKTVMVWDEPGRNQSSREAAGLFNPITGRVMTETWRAGELFPFMKTFYKEAEEELGVKFLHEMPLYRPFVSASEQLNWKRKAQEGSLPSFINKVHDHPVWEDQVINPHGGIELSYAGYLDVGTWLDAMRQRLVEEGSFVGEAFDEGKLTLGELVTYGSIQAGGIIFCNGLAARKGRYFHWLPIVPLKGETLEVKFLHRPERLYNRGVFAAPTGSSHFRVGSTYEHEPFIHGPSPEARTTLEAKLRQLFVSPFEVIHQGWGIRPTSKDRRPMLGCHPVAKNVFLFNGLGTKGVSLAPYFARQLTRWMTGEGRLDEEVNIWRFKALYSGD